MHSHGIVIELSSERVNDGIDKPKQLIVTFQNLLEHESLHTYPHYQVLHSSLYFSWGVILFQPVAGTLQVTV